MNMPMSRVQETVVTYDSMVQHCGDEPGAYVPVSCTGYVPVSGMPISDESFDGMQDDDFFAEEDDMSRRTSPFSYSSLSGRTTRARRTGSVPFHVGQRITDWVPSSDDDECSGILSAFLAAPKKLHARSTVNTLLGSLYVNLMGGEPSIYSTKASFSKWWHKKVSSERHAQKFDCLSMDETPPVLPALEASCIKVEKKMKQKADLPRLTIGDFDRIPSYLPVDKERCYNDQQYAGAIRFLALIAEQFAEGPFNLDKRYRDAVNLLAGRTVRVSYSFPEELLYARTLIGRLQAAAAAPVAAAPVKKKPQFLLPKKHKKGPKAEKNYTANLSLVSTNPARRSIRCPQQVSETDLTTTTHGTRTAIDLRSGCCIPQIPSLSLLFHLLIIT